MVLEITEDALFQPELTNAGAKLVVVDFHATWCGPCRTIAPVFAAFALKYPNAVFLKVDVDKCPQTAAKENVSAMPTFILYRNSVKVDSQRGADQTALENKIKQHYGSGEAGSEEGEPAVKGHIDLVSMVVEGESNCLNESDDHTFTHALKAGGGYLESDCDEQLLITLSFSQAVKLHTMRLRAPTGSGPRNIKLFINQPSAMDFDMADSYTAQQALLLEEKDMQDDSLIPLKYVKFQNVRNISIFVKDNLSDAETTQIDHLVFFGSPVAATTNMNDFKRVAGKKGESE